MIVHLFKLRGIKARARLALEGTVQLGHALDPSTIVRIKPCTLERVGANTSVIVVGSGIAQIYPEPRTDPLKLHWSYLLVKYSACVRQIAQRAQEELHCDQIVVQKSRHRVWRVTRDPLQVVRRAHGRQWMTKGKEIVRLVKALAMILRQAFDPVGAVQTVDHDLLSNPLIGLPQFCEVVLASPIDLEDRWTEGALGFLMRYRIVPGVVSSGEIGFSNLQMQVRLPQEIHFWRMIQSILQYRRAAARSSDHEQSAASGRQWSGLAPAPQRKFQVFPLACLFCQAFNASRTVPSVPDRVRTALQADSAPSRSPAIVGVRSADRSLQKYPTSRCPHTASTSQRAPRNNQFPASPA